MLTDSTSRQDTNPSTLDRSIASDIPNNHDPKRAKLSEAPDTISVASLIESKAYNSISDVVKDLDSAVTGIIDDYEEAMTGDQGHIIAREARKGIHQANALKKEFDRLIQREMAQSPDVISLMKGIKTELSEDDERNVKDDGVDDNVLTLLADNRPPKQLFSSIRRSTGSSQTLSDLALPNGITTTKITPLHSINEDGKNPVPKFKEVFAAPSLPPLTLPKQSKHTLTKSSSINWYNPAETESKPKPNRRENYTTQGLSTGQWLTYNVAPSRSQMVSPESKRKPRDRALSVGEAQTALSEETIAAHNQAKEDALFRSVYSSFAPGRDDSAALVAEQQKNRLWYAKYGETKYRELLDTRDNNIANTRAVETDGVENEEELDLDELEKNVKNWQSEEDVLPEGSNEADDILQEISDLLETLDSHRQIRASTTSINSRPLVGQNPQIATLATSPTSPSAAEFDVYEMLKNQLTLIVSTLPPYLLSKLDGDKLGALKISTKVQVETKNQKGAMEETEVPVAARRTPAPVAAPVVPPQSANAYGSVPGRSSSYVQAATPAQQYSRSYGASTAPRPATHSSYLQNPQSFNRPASSNYASSSVRPPYATQNSQTPQASAAPSSRYNYAQQYGQQQSQSSYGSYQNGYRSYTGQNGNSYNYNTHYASAQARPPITPAQIPPPYRGSQTDYSQRAVPPQGYGYGNAQVGGSASPQIQQRPSFSGQGQSSSNTQRPPLLQQHSSQYSNQAPGSPLVNGTTPFAPTQQQGHMSADEQAATMSRQKAQLAEQQSRQGSGTPQPASRQYTPQQQNGAQQNGTPVPQQNGIAAG